MTEWFKVKDKLPPERISIIFWDNNWSRPIAACYDCKEWFTLLNQENSFEIDEESAIWCHLPEELPEWAKK